MWRKETSCDGVKVANTAQRRLTLERNSKGAEKVSRWRRRHKVLKAQNSMSRGLEASERLARLLGRTRLP